ncbi:MAG: TolC family protein, partial [Bacteroidales bacterium]
DKQIEIKRFAKKEKIGALLPNISGSAQYNRTLKKQKFIFGGGGMPGMGGDSDASADSKPVAVEVGTSNSWSGGFNISLPLVAPTLWKNVQMGSIDIEKAVEASRQSHLDMAKQVQDAYYNVLLSEDSYDVILKSYNQAKANAEVTRERLKQGVVSEYDLIRADVQVKNMEPNLLQAESGVALSKLMLKTLLGLEDIDIDVDVEGSLDEYRKNMYAESLNATTGIEQNSTLRQLDLEVRSMKTALKMQQFAYIPTLAANFNYSYNALSDDFKFKDYQWFPYSTIGFSLQIPIFEGGAKYYRNKQTKVGIQTLGLQRIDLERNLNMQLKNAKDQINRTVRQVESTQGGIELAEKGLTIARKRYETGMGTFIELNDAEIALLQSELQYNQAIYEYLSAKSALENILGTFDYSKYTQK